MSKKFPQTGEPNGNVEIERKPGPQECVCGCDTFEVYYDPNVQAMHVECAYCGTVLGGIK